LLDANRNDVIDPALLLNLEISRASSSTAPSTAIPPSVFVRHHLDPAEPHPKIELAAHGFSTVQAIPANKKKNDQNAQYRQRERDKKELMETELKNARIELLKKDTRIELLEQQVEQLRNERDQAVLASMANGQRLC